MEECPQETDMGVRPECQEQQVAVAVPDVTKANLAVNSFTQVGVIVHGLALRLQELELVELEAEDVWEEVAFEIEASRNRGVPVEWLQDPGSHALRYCQLKHPDLMQACGKKGVGYERESRMRGGVCDTGLCEHNVGRAMGSISGTTSEQYQCWRGRERQCRWVSFVMLRKLSSSQPLGDVHELSSERVNIVSIVRALYKGGCRKKGDSKRGMSIRTSTSERWRSNLREDLEMASSVVVEEVKTNAFAHSSSGGGFSGHQTCGV
ncbi:hypothetical protein B0H13DRAFT_1881717 [Mycena leptocephala]|nr:hypothetical protein B0H13DRAFT_1881717 [Mycena leptocephala]